MEVGEPTHLEALRAAAAGHEQVEIDYYSFGRDAITTRGHRPHAVFHTFGAVVRRTPGATGRTTSASSASTGCGASAHGRALQEPGVASASRKPAADGASRLPPRPDDPRVTLELGPSAAWVVESYPCEPPSSRTAAAGGHGRERTDLVGAARPAAGPDVAVEGPPVASLVAPDAGGAHSAPLRRWSMRR